MSWAIQVHCLRPTVERYIIHRRFSKIRISGRVIDQESPNGITYRKRSHKEISHECDPSVYQRMQQACLYSQKWWLALVPFYGITDLKEIIECFMNHLHL